MAYGISNTVMSNMSTVVTDINITPVQPDIPSNADETTYQNMEWTEQYGYFLEADDFQSALMMQSVWTVGKGYTADSETTIILDHISGFGKESFHDIIFNMNLTAHLAGDSYAEIIKDEETNTILNLKLIDPGTMKIIVDKKGIIKRYEQVTLGETIKFKPNQIFHLSNKKIGASIHGISDLRALKKIIAADYESFVDTKKIMHRQARPMLIFKLATDDMTKITAFKNLADLAMNMGENLYVPWDEKTLSYEVVQVNINAMLLSWRDHLTNKFFRALGLPLSLFGSSGATESGSKIEYLGHETIFTKNALFLETQIWNQLYLKVKFNSPATLLDNLQTDEAKDGNQGLEIQQQDVTAGKGQ